MAEEKTKLELSSGDMPGLGTKPLKNGLIRRRKRAGTLQREKNGIYTIRLMIHGRRIAKSTHTRDLTEAKRVLDEFSAPFVRQDRVEEIRLLQAKIADIDQREALEEEFRPQMSLRNSWWYYIDSTRRKQVSEATLIQKRHVWESFIKWICLIYDENMEVRHVTPEIVETYLRFMRKNVSPTTWNGRLCYLREIYRVIMPKAKAKANPFADIPLLPESNHPRRGLRIEEVKRLLEMAKLAGGQWHTLFLFGIYTGLRLGDCCRLVWDQVNFEQNIIQLIPAKKRNVRAGMPATIPLHPHLLRLLTILKAGADADTSPRPSVMGRKGRPRYVLEDMARLYNLARHKMNSTLTKIFIAAGIRTSVKVEGRKRKAADATFHSLRHTFVSLAANAGVPLHVIQSIVGHQTSAMTWHYYHVDEDAMRKAICAIPTFDGREEEKELKEEEESAESEVPSAESEVRSAESEVRSEEGREEAKEAEGGCNHES